jgi:hypothetical protein
MGFFNLYKTRVMRFLVTVTLCMVMIFSFTANAFAASGMTSNPSSPKQGEAKLDEVYGKSEDALRNPPLSARQVESEANKGVNEVQGAADLEKMKSPENSGEATTVEEQVEKVLDKATLK